MSIPSVTAGQFTRTPYPTQQNPKQAESSSIAQTGTSDSVQISAEAKQLSQSIPPKNADSAVFDPEIPPLEALAVPKWFGQYTAKSQIVNVEINHGFHAFLADLEKSNTPREEQRQLIANYLDNDPSHQAKLEENRFRNQYRHEIEQYGEIVNQSYKAALEENGLNGPFAYYQKVTLEHSVSSEKVHQDFREHLLSSPGVNELMDILGVNIDADSK